MKKWLSKVNDLSFFTQLVRINGFLNVLQRCAENIGIFIYLFIFLNVKDVEVQPTESSSLQASAVESQ